ncbi:MAG: hypothetical protein HKN21_10720, partial [Candidatus Eisenbacteria bacterium]|nr:hypothetical protein [Candidatus Eisenbacteria bacterium]
DFTQVDTTATQDTVNVADTLQVAEPAGIRCSLLDPPPNRGGSFTLALVETVDPTHAPFPTNSSEALVFGGLYETLVTIDCDGQILPGLAEAWSLRSDDRIWTFQLRENAAFSDGQPITAAAVVASWRESYARNVGKSWENPWTFLDPEAVTILDRRRLRVTLKYASGPLPQLFAHPALAVASFGVQSSWPVGSGPLQIIDRSREGKMDLWMAANVNYPGKVRNDIELRFLIRPGADPRDLLGDEIDLMLVRDLDMVDYAASIPEFRVKPLPWDKLYLAVSVPLPTSDGETRVLTDIREQIAAEVVRHDARANPTLKLGGGAPICKLRTYTLNENRFERGSAPEDSSLAIPVAYRENDPTSQSIAERLVALTATEQAGPLPDFLAEARDYVVSPLSDDGFDTRLETANYSLFILGLPKRFMNTCHQAGALGRSLKWILPDPKDQLDASDVFNRTVIPLVATRGYLVYRPAITGVALSWDGAIRLEQMGTYQEKGVP